MLRCNSEIGKEFWTLRLTNRPVYATAEGVLISPMTLL
jgi:hypothetical protein